MHGAHVGDRLGSRAHVGFGDDLDERRAGAVEIDSRHALEDIVQGFSGVFLQMRAGYADSEGFTVLLRDLDVSVVDDGQLILADLIALGQVRIKVVLAGKNRAPRDLRIDGESERDGHAHRLGVEHRQDPRKTQIHRARLGVRRRSVSGGGAREDLAPGRELGVNLETDNGFPMHVCAPRVPTQPMPGGMRACQSLTCWYW